MVFRILVAILLLTCALLAQEPQHEHAHEHGHEKVVPKRQLETALGVLSVPGDSTWENRPIKNGTLYVGRQPGSPPRVYLMTLGDNGVTLLWGVRERMDQMAREYCASLATTFGSEYQGFRNRLTDRGCQFACRLRDGGSVLGRIYLGRYNTVTLAGIDCTQSEFDEYVHSFAPSPRFVLPSGPYDSAARIAFGYAAVCALVNLVFVVLVLWYHSEEPARASDWISGWLVGLLVLEAVIPLGFAARIVPEASLLGVLSQAVIEHLVLIGGAPLVLGCWLAYLRQKALYKRKEPG
ncbi:hypothetical protein JST97_18055 [bacterium]|nr:hypothetical protein [bacterium]